MHRVSGIKGVQRRLDSTQRKGVPGKDQGPAGRIVGRGGDGLRGSKEKGFLGAESSMAGASGRTGQAVTHRASPGGRGRGLGRVWAWRGPGQRGQLCGGGRPGGGRGHGASPRWGALLRLLQDGGQLGTDGRERAWARWAGRRSWGTGLVARAGPAESVAAEVTGAWRRTSGRMAGGPLGGRPGLCGARGLGIGVRFGERRGGVSEAQRVGGMM